MYSPIVFITFQEMSLTRGAPLQRRPTIVEVVMMIRRKCQSERCSQLASACARNHSHGRKGRVYLVCRKWNKSKWWARVRPYGWKLRLSLRHVGGHKANEDERSDTTTPMITNSHNPGVDDAVD